MRQPRASILVVDDEPTIGEVVSRYLERAGYETRVAADGLRAIELSARRRPDLVVLDLMLPGIDGLEVLAAPAPRRRPAARRTAVIVLTANGEESDRVIGLRLGADDYVVKPFSPAELIARVDAVLRRTEPAPASARSSWATCGSSPAVAGCWLAATRSSSPSASSTCCCSSRATRAARSRATSSWTRCGVLGDPVSESGLGDEQAMRAVMLLARTGRRLNEILLLDFDPMIAVDGLSADADAGEAVAAKLRYQQTKIDDAPDTILVDTRSSRSSAPSSGGCTAASRRSTTRLGATCSSERPRTASARGLTPTAPSSSASAGSSAGSICATTRAARSTFAAPIASATPAPPACSTPAFRCRSSSATSGTSRRK